MKKKKSTKKLSFSKETLAALDAERLEPVAGHVAGYCPPGTVTSTRARTV